MIRRVTFIWTHCQYKGVIIKQLLLTFLMVNTSRRGMIRRVTFIWTQCQYKGVIIKQLLSTFLMVNTSRAIMCSHTVMCVCVSLSAFHINFNKYYVK